MSTDPKKLVKTILLTYLLASVILASGYTCRGVPVLIVTFSAISLLLYGSAVLALHQNYKKYKIAMYRFLEGIGIAFCLFAVIMAVMNL